MLAVAALAVAIAVVFNATATPLRLAGTRIRIGDPSRALWAAGVLAAALLVTGRSRTGHALAGVLLAATGFVTIMAIARSAEAPPPVGDVGVIETYIFQALRGQLFLGPYSRFLWHHPGPIYFFLLAPFYVLSGYKTVGVAAGALAINVASVVTIGWVARRYGGRRIALILAGACALYSVRFSALLTSQWNPHVLVFPTLACMVTAAAVSAGATALLPALVAFASLAAETHLGLVPTVGAVTACALVAAFLAVGGEERPRLWWHLNTALWLAFVLWILPVVQEITASPGNLTRLWHFFASGPKGQPLAVSVAAWSGAVTGAFRPSFALAWGGEVPHDVSAGVPTLAVGMVAALAASCILLRARRPFESALAGLAAVASIVALWSVTRIAGEIVDHEVFWMSGLGALGAGVVIDAGVERALRGARSASFERLTDWLTVAALLSVFALGVLDLRRRAGELDNPGSEELAAATLSEEIVAYARAEHVPRLLIVIDSGVWGVAAGVLVELDRAGVRYAVEPGAVWMFGESAAPDGTETRTVRLSGYGGHGEVAGRPGVTPLAARRGFFADVVAAR